MVIFYFFFFQAEDGIRDYKVTGVQTCALPISMTLAFASAYGGSTVVYTGTSLTAPQRVIRAWGVPGLEHADLTRRSAKYAEQNNVHALDDPLINDNNRLFVEGGRKAGYLVEQFPVNVKGCRGSSLCNLGWPNQAKQGTNRVQLPRPEPAAVEG